MKKLLEKDKILRQKIKTKEKLRFILKSISKNSNFFALIRWNAGKKYQAIAKLSPSVATQARCVASVNKKRFNKLTTFSRYIFLKLLRSGQIHGFKKSSW